MPRVIQADTDERIELAELVEALETGDFDARDEDNFASWGPMLKKLGNNRDFLIGLMMNELKQRGAGQVRDNQYSAQVILLHATPRYFIRANFWPAASDSVIRQSGTDPFFYNVPHDHNFSFLTVGYLGPGYWSDYYEYDYDRVVGYPGEHVDLRFVEKTRLAEGKVMLYRAHRDVHRQLTADAMSVSLNIAETSPAVTFRDQYRFDIEGSRIDGVMTNASIEPMLALAAHYGGGDGLDLIAEFAKRHPNERIRWAALRARAAAAGDLDGRLAVLQEGARASAPFVAAMAKRAAERLEAGRAWIDAPPAVDGEAATA
jgi:hypothetical protein